MKIDHIKYIPLIATGLFIHSCSTQQKSSDTATQPPKVTVKTTPAPQSSDTELKNIILPEVNREFRAAWVATVANINWPSKNNLSTAQQKAEAIAMLDMLKDANFNAVVFQARPSSDALYKSDLEPWSVYLNGEVGKAPSPYYDPLEFWISEAHKRGMELHVWLNPYRAYHTTGGTINDASMVRKMSSEVLKLRNGTYWFDPSSQKVQDHVSNVVKDLVKRYDLDAIHFDDYFYPYAEYNGGKDFPDSKTWNMYQKSGGTLSRADWRRANVNKFVKRIYDEIKAEKNTVKFGISPFGIWKPGYPSGISGSSQYDELYADAKLWLNEGWVDYFSPQLYWKIGGAQDFNALLNWWEGENYKGRHLWPGLNTVGVRNVPNKAREIAAELQSIRSTSSKSKGSIHYSIAGLTDNSEMLNTVKNIYKEKALVPASPWLKHEDFGKPEITVAKSASGVNLHWWLPNSQKPASWILYSKYGNNWEAEIFDKQTLSQTLTSEKAGKKLTAVAIKAVDRAGNEGEYTAKAVK